MFDWIRLRGCGVTADQGSSIAPIAAHHKSKWRALYNGYAAFYRRPMNDAIAEQVWAWLFDKSHVVEGLVALSGGEAVGLAHYRSMPSPLRGADIGFLDDLFVAPEMRGGRLGEQLVERVRAIAGARGWVSVRWLTADDNYRARTLYDRVAAPTQWKVYELSV